MIYQQTTQVPNILFDAHLPQLTESELKLLLVIIRQTNGWVDKRTGRRKTRDRISHNQFIQKTGLSRRVISKTLQSLVDKRLIYITCQNGNPLHLAKERKGKSWMFYAFQSEAVKPKRVYGVRHIGEILQKVDTQKTLS